MAKEIYMNRVSIRIPSGHLGHIGAFESGRLRESQLPLPVVLVDAGTGEKYTCNLVEVIPFKQSIPTAFILFSEGEMKSENELLLQNNRKEINQLAFYIYEQHQNHAVD